MSKFSDGLQYYLIVVAVGLVATFISVAFYLLYFALWNFTQNAVSYSKLIFLPIAFLFIGLPYVLVKLFATTKITGSRTYTVLEAYHLSDGEVCMKDAVVKPAAAFLTIGLGGSAGPESPSLLAGVLPVVDDDAHVAGVVNLEDLGNMDVRRQEISLSETVLHKPT